jgi:Xaa-Pro aminopeptidase
VAVAYAFVTQDGAQLFVDSEKLPELALEHLRREGVRLLPYESALPELISMGATFKALEVSYGAAPAKIWMDGNTVNQAFFGAIDPSLRIEKRSPVVLMKALKNSKELDGLRACHLRDGAAVCEFMCWLEKEVTTRQVSEVEIDEKITSLRKEFSAPGVFLEPSFDTIAGVNANGAIIHYKAQIESCKSLGANDMLLLDSGGQYLDGTTDVTRTIHTGTPSSDQIEMFTRVLKGNIGLDSRVFPVGTAGCVLDTYAREHLWAVGKDYLHGTGHGVGAALNVHEGPQRIARVLDPQPLMAGMVVSNEPGYYEPGNYGIRIENLLIVAEKSELGEYGGKSFLGFEKLTHIPIQKRLIDPTLMTPTELAWLNAYHNEIREKVLIIAENIVQLYFILYLLLQPFNLCFALLHFAFPSIPARWDL